MPSYHAQEAEAVSNLVFALDSCRKESNADKKKATSKKTTFQVAGRAISSWQFKEWDYARSDLPTYARGLFTYAREDGVEEIAVRGYDKFFNVGEVNETRWDAIESRTTGPYELSVKENGCIIFLSGLEGDDLLICSKHSTGPRQDAQGHDVLSHAVAGERWVDRHLATIGRSRKDLARQLRQENITAVAELCDDEFEEHVLAYEPKDAGLYLHGINANTPEFITYSGDEVHRFAETWGFRKAQFLTKSDIPSMRSFLEDCAQSGSYAGRDTEGFVIRCRRRNGSSSSSEGAMSSRDWFFKYKFEEPYLMYRQWRECTKAVIANREPRFKKHIKITEKYLLYVRRQFAQNPDLAQQYEMNHGIIAMREGFLREQGMNGAEIIRQEEMDIQSGGIGGPVILLPVATIGCGKTTVAVALCKLFGWGHVQNDNITGKGNRPKTFTHNICNDLTIHPVCIGDRNNHQKRERAQIINDVTQLIPAARFICLHYVHDPKVQMLPKVRQVTRDRIFARGDNHQTIQAGSKPAKEIIGIMDGFLNRFEPVDPRNAPDDAFESIIDLDVSASSRQNLETVVLHLHNRYPTLVPSMLNGQELDDAIEAALNQYKPHVKHDLSFKSKRATTSPKNGLHLSSSKDLTAMAETLPKPPKPPKLEYFCIKMPSNQIHEILASIFSAPRTHPCQPFSTPTNNTFYQFLMKEQRVQPKFHVTLIHTASHQTYPDIWQKYSSMHAAAVTQSAQAAQGFDDSGTNPPVKNIPTFDPILGKCHVQIERCIWDSRVMCLVVRILDPGWPCANAIPHITIGTARPHIKPKECNGLLQRWLSGDSTAAEDSQIVQAPVSHYIELIGEVRAVMQHAR